MGAHLCEIFKSMNFCLSLTLEKSKFWGKKGGGGRIAWRVSVQMCPECENLHFSTYTQYR